MVKLKNNACCTRLLYSTHDDGRTDDDDDDICLYRSMRCRLCGGGRGDGGERRRSHRVPGRRPPPSIRGTRLLLLLRNAPRARTAERTILRSNRARSVHRHRRRC